MAKHWSNLLMSIAAAVSFFTLDGSAAPPAPAGGGGGGGRGAGHADFGGREAYGRAGYGYGRGYGNRYGYGRGGYGYGGYGYGDWGWGWGLGFGLGLGLYYPYYGLYDPYYGYGAYPVPAGYDPNSGYVPAVPAGGGPNAAGTQPPPAGARPVDNAAHLQLLVPANAEVWINGVKSPQSGQVQEMVTPALVPGNNYSYRIEVRYKDPAGNDKLDSRVIHFRANSWFSIDLTRPVPARINGPAPRIEENEVK